MKSKKTLFTIIQVFIILIAVLGSVIYYEYHRNVKPLEDIVAQKITAPQLFKAYNTNEELANKTYQNKALEINGKVLEVKNAQQVPQQIILDAGDAMFGIACTMEKPQIQIKPGDVVTIKGICTGYLNDVVIIRALLLK